MKLGPCPSQFPAAYVVAFVQELGVEQTGNVQFLQSGVSPSKKLASVDFPAPVWPTITILGSCNFTIFTIANMEKMISINLTIMSGYLGITVSNNDLND